MCLLLAAVLSCGTVSIALTFASENETAQGIEELSEAEGADSDAQADSEGIEAAEPSDTLAGITCYPVNPKAAAAIQIKGVTIVC